ncbi:hypothetical protein [Arcicella rosea]|uniref:SH3 domain-containing protein n=1 Tax=Arcicella rosea TaxID=502909 RepID=A0A841ETQ8_9BACT|nr:hypothetical protein [Arcicella rosea]MBB6002841.1 hypothetical protein [Arcicella rosea]
MEIKKVIILILLTTYTVFGQNTQLDTLRQFQGHWVFKMAVNPDFTEEELAKTYPEQGHKIHIQGTRIYGNFMGMYENLSLNLATLESNGGNCFVCAMDKIDSIALQKLGVYPQPWMGIYQFRSPRLPLPYLSLQLLLTQKYLKVGIDQTMFLLERDNAEYLFCKEDNVNLNITPNVPSFNSLKKNEEVEVLFRRKEWVKVRYWGKALLEGWVKAEQLRK